MPSFRLLSTFCVVMAAGAGGMLLAKASEEPAADSKPAADSEDASAATTDVQPPNPKEDDVPRVPIAVARDRAKVMQGIYLSTLHVMHDRYFHADRSIIPARAMEDVFTEIERQTGSQANWISVNMKAMSINHEPKTEFEKRAAREIAAGEDAVEVIEDGFFRQASPVSMTGGCISCHAGFFNQPSKSRKYTGLVISIPITPEPVSE
ncbi:MAG TPA: DUF3365 domain-containing protein [Planctomycetaceae bacterium]|nr:DUF3365 domain-containing protein [Planctomycetaceae bacterium]